MTGEGLWIDGMVVGDRYRIESFLDQGAAGEVYAARNVWTDRPVALKRLQPQHLTDATTVERFLLEGRIGGRIEHPNVVQTLDMGREDADGSLFIVQELLRGCGMRSLLDRSPRMTVCEALDLMIPIMGAVYAVHQHGIVHRDIKPENIFIADGVLGHRTPKLLDFGIAKVRLQETLTQRGTVLGTLDYMAPEQLLGEHEIDRRADVWAVGVVFYELLASKTPFETASVGATINRILTEDPPSLCERCGDVDEELDALLKAAMRKNRHERPGSMEALLEGLLHWVNGHGRAAERRMVSRHRASIPAMLEARLGHDGLPGSVSDPLRATFRGLSSEGPASEGGSPVSSTGPLPGFDASVSQMIPIVVADEIPDSELSRAGVGGESGGEPADAADAAPDIEVSGVEDEEPFEPEVEEEADPTEAFILVGGLPQGVDETQAGIPDFDLDGVVRAAKGEAAEASIESDASPPEADDEQAPASEKDEGDEGEVVDVRAVLEEAREALAANAFDRASSLAEQIFVGAECEPERVEARLLQAEAASWSGNFLSTERFSVDAYLLAEPGSAAWLEAVGQMASASGTLGTHERLRDLAALLAETEVADDLIPDVVKVSCRLGIVMHRAGWPEHVEALIGRLTNEWFDLADAKAPSRGWVFALRGELSRRCDQAGSLELLEKSVAAFVDACDDRRACAMRVEVGTSLARLGALRAASDLLRQVVEEAKGLGIYVATPARARLSDVLERLGEPQESKALALTAVREAKAARDWHSACVALMTLSSIASSEGDLQAAELHARTAVGCATPSAAVQADALAVLSSILRDRPLEALMAAVQAMEVLQALQDSAEGEARIRLAHVQALEALDHLEPAKHALGYACERVMSHASGIHDDTLREQFISGVREHVLTLERGVKHGVATSSPEGSL